LKFVVGIGNPEKKYDGTRHNIGFRAIDAARKELGKREDVLLIKPDTYVNCTGDSISALRQKYGVSPSDLLLVCDDVNLVFGKLRLRASGSSGGHHGLESVIESLGSEDFARLRIGVGRPDMPKDLTGFVLEKFSREEEKELGGIMDDVVSVCRHWVENGLKAATDRLSHLKSNQKGSEE
jgi:PTH1 family peptidyl-tRNA hydrolase